MRPGKLRAYLGSYATTVPQALRDEVEQVRALIVNGTIVVTP